MKRNYSIVLLLTLILCLSLSFITSAANDNKELVGNFYLQSSQIIKINSNEYVPLEKVAGALDYRHDWDRVKTQVQGHINNRNFEANNYLIAYGYLYLPLDFYKDLLEIEIVKNGNRYYIYRDRPVIQISPDLKLVLQTDKTDYERHEPMAVSLLLINQSNRSFTLRFNNNRPYNLALKRNNRVIWSYSESDYRTGLSLEILKPGDYRLFTVLIEPGEETYLYRSDYTLEAEIVSTNGVILRNELKIEIY